MVLSTINMVEIIIADSIGLLVLFICAFGNIYRVKSKTIDGISILILIIVLAFCLICETLVSLIDGATGWVSQNGFTRVLNIVGNSISFTGNIVMACGWSVFLISHLDGYINKKRFYFLAGFLGIYLIAIIINAFVPFIFMVDSEGVYHRMDVGYLINVIIAMLLFFVDPVINFIRIKRKGGLLKFFPIWLFYIPAGTGIIFQLLNYGICTIYVGLCLGICGILMASQNDMIFRDKLTSIYNRYYLDRLKEKMMRRKKEVCYTAMMLDLNGFKGINDKYGHLVGDEALITTSKLLIEAVASFGTIIRYAGDEFVIILNTSDEKVVKEQVDNIYKTFEAYNEKKLVPYSLSVSIGYAKADLKNSTIDELMNEIDRKMYEEKMRFHELHPEWNR